MMKRYTPGFALGELSTQGGMLGALFLAGMEVMPESWKPYFVILLTVLFGVQMGFRRKSPEPERVPPGDIQDAESMTVEDLVKRGQR